MGKIFSLFWLLASRLREFKFIFPAVNVSNNTRIVDTYPRYCPILAFMQKQLSFITFLSLDNTFHLTAYTFKTKKKWQPCRFRIILDWFSLIFYRVLEHFFKNGLTSSAVFFSYLQILLIAILAPHYVTVKTWWLSVKSRNF